MEHALHRAVPAVPGQRHVQGGTRSGACLDRVACGQGGASQPAKGLIPRLAGGWQAADKQAKSQAHQP